MNSKYSLLEVERRWLLDALPPQAYNPRRIADRYIDGTRMRLRHVEDLETGKVTWKLNHKIRTDPTSPLAVNHTSMYPDEAEAAVLSTLPATRLVKTRWRTDVGGPAAAVDVFAAPLAGLIVLEIEVRSVEEATSFVAPAWFGREITNDESFTGFALARRYDVD